MGVGREGCRARNKKQTKNSKENSLSDYLITFEE